MRHLRTRRGRRIAPRALLCIFNVFGQGATVPKCSQGGLGIGLTLVKRLVEMHGGAVAAEGDGIDTGVALTV